MQKDGIKIAGYRGTWYVINEQEYKGKQIYLLEHEEWGDEEEGLIVDEDLNVILDEVYNGFDDLDEN